MLAHYEICRPQDVEALFPTLATVNYLPTNVEEIKTTMVVNLHEKDLAKVNDWFNHVWSLINLSMASNEQLQSVLK
jgi:hypothetical protein